MLLLAEFAGLVCGVDSAMPQGDQGRAAAQPLVVVGMGNVPDLQHHCECLFAPSGQ